MKKLFLSLLATSLLCSPIHAFLNIESLRQNPELGFKGSTSLRVRGTMGNTQTIVGNFQTMNAYRTEKREFLMLLSYEYGSSFGVKNSNKGSFHLRESQNLTELVALEVFAQIQFDEFRRLKSRKLLGGGLRTQLLKSTQHTVFFGIGAFYEWEELKDLVNENVARGNFYLSYLYRRSEGSRWGASLITYFQPSMKALSDNRLIVDSGMSFRLTQALTYQLNLGMSRDTRPPAQVKRTDWTYLTGLALNY